MKKDIISIKDLSATDIEALYRLSDIVKTKPARYGDALKGKTLALVFEKPSNRTRVSFAVGMHQLGGDALYLSPQEISLGVRESVSDVMKTLSRYVDGIVLRTFSHGTIIEAARAATVPVINGLSDYSHPCQALADIYTIREKVPALDEVTLAYIGDGNNVCTSLLFVCARLGVRMQVATPKGYEPQPGVVAWAKKTAQARGVAITVGNDPFKAVAKADVVYTDVWASMGQEKEAKERRQIFKAFQLNSRLLKAAKKDVFIMHCLPAHRGEEITDEVIEGPHSIVFDQAENRLHVQKAILLSLLSKGGMKR